MIKIPITLQIAVLTVALTGFYMMVGQFVPQKEVHPPEVVEIAADISTDELVEIGQLEAQIALARGDRVETAAWALELLDAALPKLEAVRVAAHVDQWEQPLFEAGRELREALATTRGK